MLSGPRWLALEVKYLDRAQSFYESFLDLDVRREREGEVALAAGDTDLILRRPTAVPRGGVHTHYAFSTPPDHTFVESVATAAEETTAAAELPANKGGAVRPFGAATEASYFAPVPTVVFGPGDLADDAGAVAHAAREYVRVHEVETAAETVTAVIDRVLG